MAVQQNKKSPSKRGMHRSHNALDVPAVLPLGPPLAKRTCVTTSADRFLPWSQGPQDQI